MKKFKPTYKKILISGYYGFNNFGDETILSVLVDKLKQYDTHIRVLSKNPRQTRKLYGVFSNFYFCLCQVICRTAQSDILISGGGSLLQDATSIKSLIYYLWVINTALFFKKKVVIFAQGLGPINNKFGAFLTKQTLKRCTIVSVRDRKSKMILNKWGIDADLVCDPLFGLTLPEYKPENKVGVQLRSFKTLSDKLLKKLAFQVNKDFSEKDIEIFSFQDSLDLEVCKKFEKYLKEINPEIKSTVISNLSSQEVLEKLSKLEYMIGMRFHACLVAIKFGIKTLAVSYDIKVEKLAEEAEIPCLTMSGDENYDEYFEQLKNLDSQKLIDYSNSKTFDWSKIEALL